MNLEKMCLVQSVSAHEDNLINIISNELKNYNCDITRDNIGNLIAHKKGNGKKIMFCTPIDEVGGVVTFIENNGNIRFSNVGNIKPETLLNCRVTFENSNIGFVKTECKNLDELSFSQMYVDIGAKNREESEKLVQIGDVFCTEPNYFQNEDCIITSADSSKAGAYALCEAIKEIDSCNDLYFVFATRSKVGHKGAKTVSVSVDAEYVISIDSVQTNEKNVKTHCGVIVNVKDSSFIADRILLENIKNKLQNVKHILGVDIKKISQASVMWEAANLKTAEICFPVQYNFETYKKICLSDIDELKKAICEIAKM